MKTAKTPYTKIEEIIEAKLAALFEDYDLDEYDIAEIRNETYKEHGWYFDPFAEEEEEEPEIYEPYAYEPSIESGWAFF